MSTLFVLAGLLNSSVYGQTSFSTLTVTGQTFLDGDTGIGTHAPLARLHVKDMDRQPLLLEGPENFISAGRGAAFDLVVNSENTQSGLRIHTGVAGDPFVNVGAPFWGARGIGGGMVAVAHFTPWRGAQLSLGANWPGAWGPAARLTFVNKTAAEPDKYAFAEVVGFTEDTEQKAGGLWFATNPNSQTGYPIVRMMITASGDTTMYGRDNRMPSQTLTGPASIVTQALGDARYLTPSLPVKILNTTGATESGTGALVVAGGLSVGQDAYIRNIRVGNGSGGQGLNTVLGGEALNANTTGIHNTATGYTSLYSNTTGSSNTGFGRNTLYSNTTGDSNTALGLNALYASTTGGLNTASGAYALYFNTTGKSNTADGLQALYYNTTGSNNAALGRDTGRYQADGATVLSTPNNSVYVGAFARGFDNNDNNAIVIGYQAIGKGANTTVIGNATTTSAHIYGKMNVSSLEVATDATVNGQLIITTPAGGISMGEFGNL